LYTCSSSGGKLLSPDQSQMLKPIFPCLVLLIQK